MTATITVLTTEIVWNYSLPNTLLGALHVLSHRILITLLPFEEGYFRSYHKGFTNEERGLEV